MSKLKKGDTVRFPFAGTIHIGTFEGITEVEYGSVKRTFTLRSRFITFETNSTRFNRR